MFDYDLIVIGGDVGVAGGAGLEIRGAHGKGGAERKQKGSGGGQMMNFHGGLLCERFDRRGGCRSASSSCGAGVSFPQAADILRGGSALLTVWKV